jgi:hypothetical protein
MVHYLADSPPARPVWGVELPVIETSYGLPESAGSFGNPQDPLRPHGRIHRRGPLEFTNWITQIHVWDLSSYSPRFTMEE